MLIAWSLRGIRPLLSLRLTCLASLILPLVFFGASGCGSKEGANSVSGKITLKGDPVNAKVKFVGGGKEAEGATTLDGSYTVNNPPVGSCKVYVTAMPGAVINPTPVKDAPSMGGKSPGVPPPAKYGTEAGAITYEVKPGKQTYNIELEP